MLRPTTTTDERRRQIAAANLSDPMRANVARDEQLRAALAELDEIRHRLCSALMHSRDGRVGNPLVARAMVGDAMPWEVA